MRRVEQLLALGSGLRALRRTAKGTLVRSRARDRPVLLLARRRSHPGRQLRRGFLLFLRRVERSTGAKLHATIVETHTRRRRRRRVQQGDPDVPEEDQKIVAQVGIFHKRRNRREALPDLLIHLLLVETAQVVFKLGDGLPLDVATPHNRVDRLADVTKLDGEDLRELGVGHVGERRAHPSHILFVKEAILLPGLLQHEEQPVLFIRACIARKPNGEHRGLAKVMALQDPFGKDDFTECGFGLEPRSRSRFRVRDVEHVRVDITKAERQQFYERIIIDGETSELEKADPR